MNLPDPYQLIQTMGSQLKELLQHHHIEDPAFVGVRTGGVWVAQALLNSMQMGQQPLGTLDVSFYRDDFSQKGLHPQVEPTALPFEVEGQHLVLIDDVLMSGRTIRAALNELFDYGRPQSVVLVCLLDLNARELPIRADILGQTLSLPADQRVKLEGPDTLSLTLTHVSHTSHQENSHV